ncbi:type II toxin-antitoxin system RelE/ParE family toxin [Amphibiibacter pelophylacis]|uniref:Type II toxin-antitoxin system RelE/ParE family toxin n=1 Tax=Amphibiibacter pelophylacis TaxID=1799477 RepID=A0ACC6P4C7_9BURK
MEIQWTDEALDDLASIVSWFRARASERTADAVLHRIVEQVKGLAVFPERIRASDRVPGARELLVHRLPYIVFVRIRAESIVVLNVVHTARKFPPAQ